MTASGLSHRRTWALAAAAAAGVLGVLASPAGGGESIVYYQVVYANRQIRDLSEPPKTDRGIRRVIRISRIDGAYPGLEVHAVDAAGIEYAGIGTTVRKELRWNGTAWVLPEETAPAVTPPQPPKPPPPTPQPPKQLGRLLEKVRTRLEGEREKLKVADQAVVLAARVVTQAQGDQERQAAMLLLEKAQAHRQEALERVLRLEALMGELEGDGSGEAPRGAPPEGDPPAAAAEPDRPPAQGRRQVLPHRLQVWKLPPGTGRRTYDVRMAHAEPGRLGGFHYIVFADTDGDGQPDQLVARSPLATADRVGGWTRWSFTTDRTALFVGNTWRRLDAVQYYRSAPVPADTGLGDTEVFVSGRPWGRPRHRWTHPYWPGLYVRVGRPGPE